jgi:hypothetical protein
MELAAPTLKRARHTFTVPESARRLETDPHTVTFGEQTLREEMDAAKEAALNPESPQALDYALLKRIVIAIDGQPPADLDWIEKTGPKVRTLLIAGLSRATMPTKVELDAFLGSQQTEV